MGLFADKDLAEGALVCIVEGFVTTNPSDYAIEVRHGRYIETEGDARYINHSCCPNCELIGERVVVTIKSVTKDEQLFLDYSTIVFDDWTMQCACGEPNCRGLIGR